MIIDTHSHLNFKAYKGDLDSVIKRTVEENVWMINVGSKYETSKRAVEIAGDKVYAAIGLHPIYAASEFVKMKTDPNEGSFLIKEESFDKNKYRELLSDKVVAIGEIGLDYYYRPKSKTKLGLFKEKQKLLLIAQIDFAKELNLPIIFHSRMANKDLIEIINKDLKGVIHCFTGNWEEAKQYLDKGMYLGFNGIIFKLDLDEVIKNTPLDRILVETDCPYLTPPQEGEKRNEPLFVKHVIQKISELRGISFEEVADITASNAKRLFNI